MPRKYRIAEGEKGLEEVLNQAWLEVENATDSKQLDILYTIGKLTTLIKLDISKKSVRIYHEDFVNERSAPVTVKKVVADFLRKMIPAYQHQTTTEEAILKKHFVEPTYEEYVKNQSGFINGGKIDLNYESDNHRAEKVESADEISKVIEELAPKIVLTSAAASLLLKSQKKLDTLVNDSIAPVTDYAQGRKRRFSIFDREPAAPDSASSPSERNKFSKR